MLQRATNKLNMETLAFTTSLRRRKSVARTGCRLAVLHRIKMKYKSASKPFINAYNHRMCTLNVYGSTGNKQTNTRTSAFYNGTSRPCRTLFGYCPPPALDVKTLYFFFPTPYPCHVARKQLSSPDIMGGRAACTL